jgi:hypothetical protein
MLTDRITLSYPASADDLEPEDYLSSSLGVIFPDDITNQHGDPSTPVIYTSPRFGRVFLEMADPRGEGSRRLFAGFVWNAGVAMAVGLEDAVEGKVETEEGEAEEKDPWDMRDETVLELGAGTGLAGIIAAKAGAREAILTDYPAEEVLVNLRVNVQRNLPPDGEERGRCLVTVEGHEWGVVPGFEEVDGNGSLDQAVEEETDTNADADAEKYVEAETTAADRDSIRMPTPSFPESYKHHFTRILLADCLWMPHQHQNLHHSIRYFLHLIHGRVLVVAGFHTGRQKMAGFFNSKALEEVGLEVESIVEKDPIGKEREWVVDRGVEDVTERKRWLVVAVMRRIREREGGESGAGVS